MRSLDHLKSCACSVEVFVTCFDWLFMYVTLEVEQKNRTVHWHVVSDHTVRGSTEPSLRGDIYNKQPGAPQTGSGRRILREMMDFKNGANEAEVFAVTVEAKFNWLKERLQHRFMLSLWSVSLSAAVRCAYTLHLCWICRCCTLFLSHGKAAI